MRRRFQNKAYTAIIPLFLIAFLLSTGAKADDNIKTLQNAFEQLILQYEEAFSDPETDFVTEGTVMVEPAEGYYAITLPHISVKQSSGAYTDIGMIAINALPGNKDGQWKMTMAVPTPIVHYGDDGKPSTTINIGSQSFAGVWLEELNNFVKINMQYRDTIIEQATENVRITIPNTEMVFDLNEQAGNKWSGPGNIIFSDIDITAGNEGTKAHIDEISIVSNMKDYDIKAATSYQEQITALNENYTSGEEVSISTSHIMGLYNLIFDFMSHAWDAFDMKVQIQNFTMTKPPIPGAPQGHFNLGSAHYDFDMSGFHSGSVNMGIGFGFNGLSFAPVQDTYEKAIPDQANFDLRINSLPYKEIVELGRSSLQSTMDNPDAGNMVGLQALITLPQLLTNAQTSLQLKETGLGNQDYSLLANALFTTNLNAVMGVTGDAKTQIFGMDQLIENLNKASSDPEIDEEKKKKIQNILGGLAIFKMIGQIEKDDQGREIRTYNLELNEQGQALLNGTDIKMLMQSGK